MGIKGYFATAFGLMFVAGLGLGKLGVGLLGTILGSVLVLVLYVLWIAYTHGMFMKLTAGEIELPPFTYYYKEFQSSYYAAETVFHNSMLPDEVDLLHAQKHVNYMSMHYDYPNMLQDASQCRSCIGFAVRGTPSEPILKMIQRLNLDKTHTFAKGCKAVQSSFLPMTSDLSYLLSGKLVLPLWEKLRQDYRDVARRLDLEGVPFYIWENNEEISIAYGTMVGEERKQYNITSFPQPKLNQFGEDQRKLRATETNNAETGSKKTK